MRMGNEIFIENKKVCVKPLRSRLEAIQNGRICNHQRHPRDVEVLQG